MQEACEKLGKTEAQIKDILREGKLREFRDGPKLLFKTEDVDELASSIAEIDITAVDEIASADMAASGSQADISLEGTADIAFKPDADREQLGEDNILDGLDLTGLGNLTGADTTIGSMGISVLGDTDDEYKLAGDTRGDTIADDTKGDIIADDTKGDIIADDSADDMLGDLDDDINLESVGSGSGLLDLSLQADDTSLGAVLDDILPAAADGEISPGGIGAEADELFEQGQIETPGSSVGISAPVASMPIDGRAVAMYIEPEPTGLDSVCGISLFIPLAATIFTAIVMITAFRGFSPTIVKIAQKTAFADLSMIWCVTGVLAILVLLMLLIAAAMGGKKAKK